MKRPTPYIPHPAEKDHRITKFAEQEAKKTKAKANLEKKAIVYRTIINISFIVTCIATIAFMFGLLISQFNKLHIDGIATLNIIIGIIMVISALTFLTANIAKKIWTRKLFKLGIIVPIELE